MATPRFRLCLILTRSLCRREPIAVLHESLRGGADLVQLREKGMPVRELQAWTSDALKACRAAGVPLVLNDSVEVARAAGADGVHLGQDDLPPTVARGILGQRALVGWSTHGSEQLQSAIRLAAAGMVDYVGFGPVFVSATRGNREGLGAETARAAALQAAQAGLPLLAIGGITVENRPLLGEDMGLAVSSTLCGAGDPAAVARRLLG